MPKDKLLSASSVGVYMTISTFSIAGLPQISLRIDLRLAEIILIYGFVKTFYIIINLMSNPY